MTPLAEKIRAIGRDTLNQNAVLGVAATFLPTGESVAVDADTVFPTASVVKVAIVAELLAQTEEGRIDLAETVTVTGDALVAGSGALAQLTPGLRLPLRDLAFLTLSISDNTASNLCLAAVGGSDAVNARMRSWGMSETVIHRPIRFKLGPNDPPHTATGTPADFARLLSLAARGALHSPVVSRALLDLMAHCASDELLPRYLEVNPCASDLSVDAPPFAIRHKTGAVTGVRNDAGVIYKGADALVVAAFTKGVTDTRWTAANRGCETVARVGEALCAHFFR